MTYDRNVHVRLHPDGKRLFIADHNGIECVMVGAGLPPRDSGAQAGDVGGVGRVRGHFTLVGENHLLSAEGALLRLAQNIHHMFLGVKTLAPNSGAVVSHDLRVLALAVQDGVQFWSWPQLEPITGRAMFLTTRGVTPGSVSGLQISGPIASAMPIRTEANDIRGGGRL